MPYVSDLLGFFPVFFFFTPILAHRLSPSFFLRPRPLPFSVSLSSFASIELERLRVSWESFSVHIPRPTHGRLTAYASRSMWFTVSKKNQIAWLAGCL